MGHVRNFDPTPLDRGTRLDLMEALAFAGEGKVRCHYSTEELDHINAVVDRMRTGTIEGRIVLMI